MSKRTDVEMIAELSAAIESVSLAVEPYWKSVEVHALASELMTELGVTYRLYWMWSALTDWYELKPAERPQAEVAIKQAAAEWPRIASNADARDAYLDRWMFDVLGLSRRIGSEF